MNCNELLRSKLRVCTEHPQKTHNGLVPLDIMKKTEKFALQSSPKFVLSAGLNPWSSFCSESNDPCQCQGSGWMPHGILWFLSKSCQLGRGGHGWSILLVKHIWANKAIEAPTMLEQVSLDKPWTFLWAIRRTRCGTTWPIRVPIAGTLCLWVLITGRLCNEVRILQRPKPELLHWDCRSWLWGTQRQLIPNNKTQHDTTSINDYIMFDK